MNFLEYAREARKTAVYPPEMGLSYSVLGLVEEVFEATECFQTEGALFEGDPIKELGDVLWYCAAIHHEVGGRYEPSNKAVNMQMWGCLDRMEDKAIYLAGRTKKHLRGDKNLSDEIIYTVNEVIDCVSLVAIGLGSSLEEIMQKNLDKLFDRQARGVLKGDGDNR